MTRLSTPRSYPPPQVNPLDPQEEAFIREYSESLDRDAALTASGLRAQDSEAQATLMQVASQVIAKAEQLPIYTLASAMGADKIYFLAMLKRVCEAPDPHQAIKGLQLLARIHGIWDTRQGSGTNIALILGDPVAKPTPTRVSGLPFEVYAVRPDQRDGQQSDVSDESTSP